MTRSHPATRDSDRPGLLIVDDDPTFRRVLARAMEGRGYAVTEAEDVAEAMVGAERSRPRYAVVDLRMPGPSGLVLVSRLKDLDPDIRVVVLTGYASIATAIEAIKAGATHYLAKPCRAEEIVAAFGRTQPEPDMAVEGPRMPVQAVEWEYIQRVLAEHGGNIRATARALGMHRRTLQRKLAKHRPRA
jgi:two-component system response regulator RegA